MPNNKLIAFGAAAVFVAILALVGCGGTQADSSSSASPAGASAQGMSD